MSFGSAKPAKAIDISKGGSSIPKDRAHSAQTMSLQDPLSLTDNQTITSAEIFSHKMKKEYDGTVYAAYCIHVTLQSGLKWVVERRYTQFRELRKEIIKIRPQVEGFSFPKKVWLFNLSKSSLKSRQKALNAFLRELLTLAYPQLMELGELIYTNSFSM
jgi:hypothetical protein